jgi:hypothetical protein
MTQIKTVSVTYGRKMNLGDYNSANIEMSIWAELEEGDNEAEVASALWEMAKNNVKAQAIPLKRQDEARVENIYMGLPIELKNAINGNGGIK